MKSVKMLHSTFKSPNYSSTKQCQQHPVVFLKVFLQRAFYLSFVMLIVWDLLIERYVVRSLYGFLPWPVFRAFILQKIH